MCEKLAIFLWVIFVGSSCSQKKEPVGDPFSQLVFIPKKMDKKTDVISGRLINKDTKDPLEGYFIWVHNAKKGFFFFAQSDSLGDFFIPISIFTINEEYFLYISDNRQKYLTALGFSPSSNLLSTKKLKNGFTAKELTGFSFNDIEIPFTKFSLPLSDLAQNIKTELSGGFEASSKELILDKIALPFGCKNIEISHQLLVTNPIEQLNGFNLSKKPLTTKDSYFLKNSYLGFYALCGNEKDFYIEIFNPLNKKYFVYENTFLSYSSQPSLNQELFYNTTQKAFFGSTKYPFSFSGADLFFLNIQYQDNYYYNFPKIINDPILMIPKILKIALDNVALTQVNYAGITGEQNGLSIPFSIPKVSFSFEMDMPTNKDKKKELGKFATLNLFFHYYKESKTGGLEPLKKVTYTGDFESDNLSTSVDIGDQNWLVDKKELSIDLSVDPKTTDTLTLEVPLEIFTPKEIASVVQIKMFYQLEYQAKQAGGLVVFAN